MEKLKFTRRDRLHPTPTLTPSPSRKKKKQQGGNRTACSWCLSSKQARSKGRVLPCLVEACRWCCWCWWWCNAKSTSRSSDGGSDVDGSDAVIGDDWLIRDSLTDDVDDDSTSSKHRLNVSSRRQAAKPTTKQSATVQTKSRCRGWSGKQNKKQNTIKLKAALNLCAGIIPMIGGLDWFKMKGFCKQPFNI